MWYRVYGGVCVEDVRCKGVCARIHSHVVERMHQEK